MEKVSPGYGLTERAGHVITEARDSNTDLDGTLDGTSAHLKVHLLLINT